MQNIPGYDVGGSLHFCCDNQVAFTASGNLSRSCARPGDCALPYGSPVISVSASHPDQVIAAAKLALRFRNKFGKDVMTELVGWRKHGHNELDDPKMTNPILYKHVSAATPTPDAFCSKMESSKAQDIIEKVKQQRAGWQQAYDDVKADKYVAGQLCRNFGPWAEIKRANSWEQQNWATGYDIESMRYILAKSVEVPEGFNLHPFFDRHRKQRLEAASSGEKIDWGAAEAIAFGSLLEQNFGVRIAGQEAGRATFAHRHAILTDQDSEKQVCPLAEFGEFDVVNAPLTEQAVVAFEWGYSIDHPNNLCLWEAQFGDFWNQAEVSVDTLVTCGEQKWGLQSSLLMLLPHGYDGAGPEHSSSRVERLLQMTDSLENGVDSDNINFQILWPSTAAQYFHILRRQMVRNYRKPGAIVMPKTLLRLPESRSTFAEMGPNTSFQTVIDDPSKNFKAKRVIVTAGKHYFTLVNERAKRGMQNDVAIVRLEQLVPFPAKEIQETLARYTNATSFVFSQEEPRNCGAWSFAKPRLDFISGRRFSYTGRPEMPTSATGTGVMHRRQLAELLEDTFKL
jgi:probable 2-oxoglutarate dehydrogenase E1 component DHKTD1